VTAAPRASARLQALLAPLVGEAGYDLEDLSVTGAGRRSVVRVLVDKDGGITLDDVADISRVVSDALDAADEADPDLLGTSYVLEVSSPGVDRPLTEPRHWRRNAGRRVRAVLRDGGTLEGRITSADDEAVVLAVAGGERVLPWGRGRPRPGAGRVHPRAGRARRPDDDVPDDEDGEDER
jgi:ribosome maturation factor RimP